MPTIPRTIACATVLAAILTRAAHSQPAAPPAPVALFTTAPDQVLSVMPLNGGAYWVSGGISNTGFVVGDTGVIVIDPQMFVVTAQKQLAEIAKITPKPVNEIILTHSDPDHINGLPAYPRGLEIIAQENAKRDIERVVADPHSNGTPPPPQIKDYVPNHTVHDQASLTLDGVRVDLIHTAPAHTDGDLVIFLPAQKVVFAGDLVTLGQSPYPFIHLNKHGSSLGWIASMNAMLALDAEVYIPGHGKLVSKAELQNWVTVVEQRRAQIKALYDQGKSLDEIKAAMHDPILTGPAAHFGSFTETTYQELAHK